MNLSSTILGAKSEVVVTIPLVAFWSAWSTWPKARTSSAVTRWPGLYAFNLVDEANAPPAGLLGDQVSTEIAAPGRQRNLEAGLVVCPGDDFFPLAGVDLEGNGRVILYEVDDVEPGESDRLDQPPLLVLLARNDDRLHQNAGEVFEHHIGGAGGADLGHCSRRCR